MDTPAFDPVFRRPTDEERAFLRIVTRDYAVLREQIETCEVLDYDVTGWFDVRVTSGTRWPFIGVDGPSLRIEGRPPVDILLWTRDGYLESVEIVDYGMNDPTWTPFRPFVEGAAADPSPLFYP